jgi:hypothetical protein
MGTFFDGNYFVEDVAAARISNLLEHEGIVLDDRQRKAIARAIMGAMAGYLAGTDGYYGFVKCRAEKWGVTVPVKEPR